MPPDPAAEPSPKPDAPPAAEQDRIWAHAQTEEPGGFAAAKPRLDFLLKKAGAAVRGEVGSGPGGKPRVLNIGAGDGYFERTARDDGWDSHSLDPIPETVAALDAEAGITARAGRIQQLPHADGTFDVVVASEVLEHLTGEVRAAGLAEVRRVLRPGGAFLGTVPDREDLSLRRSVCPACGLVYHQYGHLARFDAGAVRAMLTRAGFGEVRVGRSAFPALRGRGPAGLLKGLLREGLARLGEPIAVPRLHWSARVPGEPGAGAG